MISGAERLRDFNAQRCDRKVVSFGIFEKKFGFYRAELDRFCVIVFGMRARSLSFVGTRPRYLINHSLTRARAHSALWACTRSRAHHLINLIL